MAAGMVVSIIDDEESVRKALRRVLTASGLRVHDFASGTAFLASLPAQRPDCVLVDMHMPGLTGFVLLRRNAGSADRLPCIAMSGKDEPGMRERVLALGADDFLTKPLDADVLLATLELAAAKVGR
jgi:FixJ family two-component response regulator